MIKPYKGFKYIYLKYFPTDLKYVRHIQRILEDHGFVTSIMQFAQSESGNEHPIFDQFPMVRTDLTQVLFEAREKESEFIDVRLNVVASSLDQILTQELHQQSNWRTLNIESCIGLSGIHLEEALYAVLVDQFSYLYFSIASSVPKLSAGDEEWVAKARYLMLMFRTYGDERMLQEVYLSEGKLLKAMQYLIDTRAFPSTLQEDVNRLLSQYNSYTHEPSIKTLFISHATADLRIVRRVQICLEEMGYRTFLFTAGYLRDLAGPRIDTEASDEVDEWDEQRERAIKLQEQLLTNSLQLVQRWWNQLLIYAGILDAFENDILRQVAVCQYMWVHIRWEISASIVDSVLIVDSPKSRESLWTLIEQDYALRIGKHLHSITIDDYDAESPDWKLDLMTRLEDSLSSPSATEPYNDMPTESLDMVFLADSFRREYRKLMPQKVGTRYSQFDAQSKGKLTDAFNYLQTFRPISRD